MGMDEAEMEHTCRSMFQLKWNTLALKWNTLLLKNKGRKTSPARGANKRARGRETWVVLVFSSATLANAKGWFYFAYGSYNHQT